MKTIEVTCECEKDLQTAAQELRDSLGGNCETCGGNGYVSHNALIDTDCPACGGSGIARNEGDRTAVDFADAEPNVTQ
jgi:DnaJ-class molecular chaperone